MQPLPSWLPSSTESGTRKRNDVSAVAKPALVICAALKPEPAKPKPVSVVAVSVISSPK